MKLPDKLSDVVTDLVSDLLFYGRKEDDELSVDQIEDLLADPEMRVAVVELFRQELEASFVGSVG